MEIRAESVNAYNKSCIGCQKTGTDVMLAVYNGKDFVDVFISQEVAKQLQSRLTQAIEENES